MLTHRQPKMQEQMTTGETPVTCFGQLASRYARILFAESIAGASVAIELHPPGEQRSWVSRPAQQTLGT